jgi:RNA polymerase sigma factor (sigma-70 family)
MVVQALRTRQPAVLEDLLATYGREIQAVAYLIVRDRGDAEDVVVETLIAALEHGRALRDEQSLRAWLLRIATNRALTMRRRTARLVRLEVVPEMAAAAAGGIGDSDSRVALLEGIAGLPPKMRAAVVLRYYADLSVDECARALGKSPNTVKAQLQESLDRLRAALADASAGQPTGTAMEAPNV